MNSMIILFVEGSNPVVDRRSMFTGGARKVESVEILRRTSIETVALGASVARSKHMAPLTQRVIGAGGVKKSRPFRLCASTERWTPSLGLPST